MKKEVNQGFLYPQDPKEASNDSFIELLKTVDETQFKQAVLNLIVRDGLTSNQRAFLDTAINMALEYQ